MSLRRNASRIFDTKPWAAHVYVTDQCNLDCHYCNEYDNSHPPPDLREVVAWLRKLRQLGVARVGLQGGEPLLHPEIIEIVRACKALGFGPISMASNGFTLTRELLAALDEAGLDSMNISVDRMRPIRGAKKALRLVQHKLAWFNDSRIRLAVSGVLSPGTLDEAPQVIQTCLVQGVSVHARVVHDDLINERTLRDGADGSLAQRLEAAVTSQEALKRRGEKIHTTWCILAYQQAMLRSEPWDWTCTAGYKYFFVSAQGKFWLCSQVRTDRDLLDITREDLRGYYHKKTCQDRCGVYCIIDTSIAVNDPVAYLAREIREGVAVAVGRWQRRARDAIRALLRSRTSDRRHRPEQQWELGGGTRGR